MGQSDLGNGVLAIIGARLNSSRLPGKHLLPLAGEPMISHIVWRLLEVEAIDDIVLATTADVYNEPLIAWAQDHEVGYLDFAGDVNDLMGRIDAVVRQHDPEIIVYVCGDSPLIEPTTLKRALAAMARDPAADTVRLTLHGEEVQTIHEGFNIYRRAFWDRMAEASVEPFECEHVGSVYHALGKVEPLRVTSAEEDPAFCDIDHRISVDTPSDYRFMSRIYDDWYGENPTDSIVSLRWVVDRLENEPALAAMNDHVHQKSVGETNVEVAIITEAGPDVGFGHLSRMTVAARALQDYLAAKVEILIRGQAVPFGGLDLLQHVWLTPDTFARQISSLDADVILMDVKTVDEPIEALLSAEKTAKIVAVDNMFDRQGPDLWYVPSFNADPDVSRRLGDRLIHGWDSYLLPDLPVSGDGCNDRPRAIIITGATDAMSLGQTLPEIIGRTGNVALEVDWVQGPFAAPPKIPKESRVDWTILNAPQDLAQTLHQYDVALCTYGVSLFECLKAGLPTIALRAPGQISDDEWSAFAGFNTAITAENEESAVRRLQRLIEDTNLRKTLSSSARGLLASSDGRRLADAVRNLLEITR